MFCWGDICLVQFLLNPLGHRLVGLWCKGSGDVRDEVREGLFAGFGEMDFLSSPQGCALFASMGESRVRRVDEQRGRRKIFGFSPLELFILNARSFGPRS